MFMFVLGFILQRIFMNVYVFLFFEFILKLNTYHLLYTFCTVVTHDYLEQLYLK